MDPHPRRKDIMSQSAHYTRLQSDDRSALEQVVRLALSKTTGKWGTRATCAETRALIPL